MKTLIALMQNWLSKENDCIVPNAGPACITSKHVLRPVAWQAHKSSPQADFP